MSIIQAVYSKILADLKNWSNVNEAKRIEIFKCAYSFFDKPFLEALTILETSPQDITIQQQLQFINMRAKHENFIIFYKKGKFPLQLECTCEAVWKRKAQNKLNRICVHQMIYLFKKYCFQDQKQNNSKSHLQQVEYLYSLLGAVNK